MSKSKNAGDDTTAADDAKAADGRPKLTDVLAVPGWVAEALAGINRRLDALEQKPDAAGDIAELKAQHGAMAAALQAMGHPVGDADAR